MKSLCIFVLASLLLPHFSVSQIDRDYVLCDLQRKVCECREDADECDFTLNIEELQTFTSYEFETAIPAYSTDTERREAVKFREEDGSSYYFNATGHLNPLSTDGDQVCVTTDEDFEAVGCTVPFTADGRTYRPFIAINGIAPGPTLIVYEGQKMIVSVVNRLISESTSVHWHGMDMINTPWMDGVVLVTQCSIDPLETFRYYFEAAPTGTFWYHSHRVEQRVDGLFGGLIIRESRERRALIENALGAPVIDMPGNHTVLIHEWSEGTTLDLFTQIKGGLSAFPGKPFGEVPLPPSEQLGTPYTAYGASSGADGLEVGDIPFWSGLINGKGRHLDVSFNRTRLEIFNVENAGGLYRFRLVGAQSLYALKFSIDEHNLTVISVDGTLVEPVEVQFIIIHTGERYDFILKAQKPRENVDNYWVRAETLEVDLMSAGPPYTPAGNLAEGILHYRQNPDLQPRSTDYESIKQSSIPFDVSRCGAIGGCAAINCPFLDFHPSYNIPRCIKITDLRQLEATPSDTLPDAEVDSDCDDCEIFFNIGSDHDTLNGRNMILPPAPLLTQMNDIFYNQFCDLRTPCPNSEPCGCTHVRIISSFNKTIRIVLSAIGNDIREGEGSSHPFHLHGHHFHVVAIRHGSYNESSGLLTAPREDIVCDDSLCTNPSWAPGMKPSFSISNKTVRKDTVIVPGGGYAVIQFRSDNPGVWFLHCHIVPDLLEGMSVIINEVESRQNPAPKGFKTCGDFRISQSTFYEKLAFVPGGAAGCHVASVTLITFVACVMSKLFM